MSRPTLEANDNARPVRAAVETPDPAPPARSTVRSARWRRARRALLWTAGTVAFVAVAGTVAVLARENRTFFAPAVDVHASRDPAVIARGRYLVSGPGHCAECHGAPERQAERAAGGEIPLSGGFEFRLPVGIFRAPNITSDAETGIGRLADGDLGRVLRYGVRANGRGMLPFMPFADLADDDLRAVISYLRSLPPVHHQVMPHAVNALGRIVKAFALTLRGPSAPPAATVPPAETPAYGRYLATSVDSVVMMASAR